MVYVASSSPYDEFTGACKIIDSLVGISVLKANKTRNVSRNYSKKNAVTLIDILEKVLPLPFGMNHWKRVAHIFLNWTTEEVRPIRELKSLQDKLEKLDNT